MIPPKHIWLNRSISLLLLIGLLSGGWLCLSHAQDHFPAPSFRAGSTDTAISGKHKSSFQQFIFDLFAEDPNNPLDTENTDDLPGSADREETEEGADDIWTGHSWVSAVRHCREERIAFTEATRASLNVPKRPLFILHCSWKSFLS